MDSLDLSVPIKRFCRVHIVITGILLLITTGN